MPTELPPQYDPKAVESRIYQQWLDAKAFHAVPDGRPREKRFSVVIPPPNVTGALHLGHAINGTIQDVLTRYHRMKGDNTLWMPGIDHAGIATQAVVERTIFEKEKKSRHDLGREELVRRIWEWKEQFGTRILKQLASIGASCDWDRTRFTLDDICARAVREAFFKMFKDGLIFRGKRLVNWDTHLQTAVADDEIYHETVKGQMTSIKYPVDGSPGGYLIVATTRPETMLGDTAVAVHPEDPRYKHLIGKHVIVPLVGRRIPIIADGLLVDPKFGTGVVKVTPAHDPNDYATGQRHNLEQINLLTADGKVNENGAGEFMGTAYRYTGMKFATAARKKVLEDLESLNLVADKKPHEHEVGHSDRSKTPIEPYLSDQWFVRMGDISPSTHASEPRPSGSDSAAHDSEGSSVETQTPEAPHSKALAYFISFHTYATWLHGQEPGSVDPSRNDFNSPFIPPDPEYVELKQANQKNPPLEFSLEQRRSIVNTLREVAAHRGWTLHVVNVRTTHVHAVVSGKHSPERMMNDFKSYATRRLVEAALLPPETKAWSRHGSTRYLWKPEHVSAAVDYALHQQGANAPGTYFDPAEMAQAKTGTFTDIPSAGNAHVSLPDGRGSDGVTLGDGSRAAGLAQAAIDAVADGRVKITPERYAKGYTDWLDQKRDWCISRQLWWGHRIPIWTRPEDVYPTKVFELYQALREKVGDRIVMKDFPTGKTTVDETGESLEGFEPYFCVAPESPDIEQILDSWGFVQDPDVLDTWFSSALWPLSTLGWPPAEAHQTEPRPSGSDRVGIAAQGSLPHGRGSVCCDSKVPAPEPGLLEYFYPTSVLSTAREILTLWVARMVMFGLYLHGEVPFKDVYIHAVIQDGEGRPMKKSLGNGVDPVDIVASHGADALRFTLAAMATETQDIRLPVVKDAKTGVNTSPKFDLGRNFANKIWNAARYILGNLGDGDSARPALRGNARPSALEDRWILSRLNATIEQSTAAIQHYRFAELADCLRRFFWTDLCDWYLEIAKARIKSGDATVQSILLHCLRTSLQLLHPMMPFITEELWSKLPAAQETAPGAPHGNAGPSRSLLITAPWPQMDPAQIDADADAHIGLLQELITEIRELQNRYPAAKGKPAIFQPRSAEDQHIVEQSRHMIEALATIKIAENTPAAVKPADAAVCGIAGRMQIFIAGVIDKATESAKLTKRKAELEKLIMSSRNKLGNEAFTSKAPANIIQGLRDQLARQETEYAALKKNLEELQ